MVFVEAEKISSTKTTCVDTFLIRSPFDVISFHLVLFVYVPRIVLSQRQVKYNASEITCKRMHTMQVFVRPQHVVLSHGNRTHFCSLFLSLRCWRVRKNCHSNFAQKKFESDINEDNRDQRPRATWKIRIMDEEKRERANKNALDDEEATAAN